MTVFSLDCLSVKGICTTATRNVLLRDNVADILIRIRDVYYVYFAVMY
jgi:hypothetical protein